jgi:endonuclease III
LKNGLAKNFKAVFSCAFSKFTASVLAMPVAKKKPSAKRYRRLKAPQVEALYKRLAALNPNPTTELNYKDPYTLLVAVTLSAQATDVGVNKATKRLFPVAHTPKQMVALGVEKLGDYIKTIGLWRNKAKNVVALSQKLLDDYDGKVPDNREALESLPGVGRKTANVVLNTAFGQPMIAVDTHIFRVSNRTGLAPGKDVVAVEKALEKVTPKKYLVDAHHWLILLGRYICKARTPECWHCPIANICLYKDKTPSPDEQKALKKSASKTLAKKKSRKLAAKPKLKKAKRS